MEIGDFNASVESSNLDDININAQWVELDKGTHFCFMILFFESCCCC